MLYGLIGKPISHSKSKELFETKFKNLHTYKLFELAQIHDLNDLLRNNTDLAGLNVTIPYKKKVIDYLDDIDILAKEIGAVNTITIERKGEISYLKGYNTDFIGFERAYSYVLSQKQTFALILGTGGASMAVAYVLKKYNIPFYFVSRKKQNESCILYNDLTKLDEKISLVINTTPVGMYPNLDDIIFIPEKILRNTSYFIDLIYNPLTTSTMKMFEKYGCMTFNGLEMLKKQAEESWRLWKLL
ncbi:MAG: shikimate dehydrogenase family protein [Bacteroidales bacterium]